MAYSAEIVADSVSEGGDRLTTMLVDVPTFLLAQMNTHRAFSRNTSSFRAIPTEILCQRVLKDPYIPDRFTGRQKGMSGRYIDDEDWQRGRRDYWWEDIQYAVAAARRNARHGVSKEDANRILLPFSWSSVVLSGTQPKDGPGAWSNFFAQRLHEGEENDSMDMQRAMHQVAKSMKVAYDGSVPMYRDEGEWHLPFATLQEQWSEDQDLLPKISAARCARVSYGGEITRYEIEDEVKRADSLITAGHWSPFEHQAYPSPIGSHCWSGNLRGWVQHRKAYEGEFR